VSNAPDFLAYRTYLHDTTLRSKGSLPVERVYNPIVGDGKEEGQELPIELD